MEASSSEIHLWYKLRDTLQLCMDKITCRRLSGPLRDVPDWLPFHLYGYLKHVSSEFCFGMGLGLRTMFDPLDYTQGEVDDHLIDDLDFCCLSGMPLKGVFVLRSHDDIFFDVVVLEGAHAGSVWNTDNMTYCKKIQPNVLMYLLLWIGYLTDSFNAIDAQSYLTGADG